MVVEKRLTTYARLRSRSPWFLRSMAKIRHSRLRFRLRALFVLVLLTYRSRWALQVFSDLVDLELLNANNRVEVGPLRISTWRRNRRLSRLARR
jgi:hypothetical protein